MNSSTSNKDKLFAQKVLPGDFEFDERVADVFDDMIRRSVPGYNTIIAMIGVLAERYAQASTNVYDLGCSLGGATLAASGQINQPDCQVHAIDNSAAMIQKLQSQLAEKPAGYERVSCHCRDIQDIEIETASMVILNLTLQFIPIAQRQKLLQKIYAGMLPGGVLIISEKIVFPDPELNTLFIDLYHQFKENMGYSRLEISQKRAALENVLIPETIESHRQRLGNCGFQSIDLWFQCFNFASLIAFK